MSLVQVEAGTPDVPAALIGQDDVVKSHQQRMAMHTVLGPYAGLQMLESR